MQVVLHKRHLVMERRVVASAAGARNTGTHGRTNVIGICIGDCLNITEY